MSDFKQLSRSVAGLTVLVTGAASGMGRATAQVFAVEGAKVAVTDTAAEGAHAVASEIAAKGGTAKAWTLDVANRDDINAVVNDVAAHFGGLDIIINNAGISVATPIDGDNYDAAWDKSLAVLLTAHQRVIRAALPPLAQIEMPADRQYRLHRSARRHRIAQPVFGGEGGRGRIDALARGGTRPRRHHRELYLSGTDHNGNDGADQGRAQGDLCQTQDRARPLRRSRGGRPYDAEPVPAGGLVPDRRDHPGRRRPDGAECLTHSRILRSAPAMRPISFQRRVGPGSAAHRRRTMLCIARETLHRARDKRYPW